MGIKVLKPRSIVSAMHLQELLEKISDVLLNFNYKTIKDFEGKYLCINHRYEVEIQDRPLDALYAYELKEFFHYRYNEEYSAPNYPINIKMCLEFTNLLICESMFDWEYAGEHTDYRFKEIRDRDNNWFEDAHRYEISKLKEWLTSYYRANDFIYEKLLDIRRITEIEGIHASFLKDYFWIKFLISKVICQKGMTNIDMTTRRFSQNNFLMRNWIQ